MGYGGLGLDSCPSIVLHLQSNVENSTDLSITGREEDGNIHAVRNGSDRRGLGASQMETAER